MKLATGLLLFNAMVANANAEGRRKLQRRGNTSGETATFNLPQPAPFNARMAQNDEQNYLVQYSGGVASRSPLFNKAYAVNSAHDTLGVKLSKAEAENLKRSPNVVIEPDQDVHVLEHIPSRALAEDTPYGVPMVLQDPDWWKEKFIQDPPTGSSKVCVVDTGYGNNHEDLPVLDQNSDGYNPYDSGEWYVDGHGHGTHCAGSIGALGNNGKGVIGVIPDDLSDQFSFYIGKGLTDSGGGSLSGVLSAVEKCVEGGANVISMSLGGGGPSEISRQKYLKYYRDDDVLIIAAAGNSGATAPMSYPASYESIMSVAAVNEDEQRASFSQANNQTEISGPGVNVLSTLPNNKYTAWSGTSMATPHVAAVGGLLRMYFPGCKAWQIRDAMIRTASLGSEGCNNEYGFGIVQAKSAFEYLEQNGCENDDGFKIPKGGCDEFQCSEDSECDDGSQDTIDKCSSGVCVHQCATNESCNDDDPCTIDTCNSNGVCQNTRDCSMCGGGEDIQVTITTDEYPSETSWTLSKEENEEEVMSGSSYTKKNEAYIHNACLHTGNYNFEITDTYGDGMCCSNGEGGYVVSQGDDELISGGEFGSEEEKAVTVNESASPPGAAPNSPPSTTSNPTFFPTSASSTSCVLEVSASEYCEKYTVKVVP